MPELPFQTSLFQLTDNLGNVIASNLVCALDTVNIPLNSEAQGNIFTDWYDLYSDNWTLPVPARSDYFVNQTTGTKYSIFGNPALYIDHLEVRISRYTGPN